MNSEALKDNTLYILILLDCLSGAEVVERQSGQSSKPTLDHQMLSRAI